MRKLILRNFQSAGDIVILTAAVRDLHRSYPGEFLTDVRTPFPDLWAHNPLITPLREDDPAVDTIDCHYPLILHANTTPCHFLHGFPSDLNDRLGLPIRVTDFKGYEQWANSTNRVTSSTTTTTTIVTVRARHAAIFSFCCRKERSSQPQD